MPITPTEKTADSYAPLAWNISVVILALEKLLDGVKPQPEERNALAGITETLRSLAEASQTRAQDLFVGKPIGPSLSEGFSTLVAIEEKSLPQALPRFQQGWEDLSTIQLLIDNQSTGAIKPDQIARAQEVCLEILENLNKQ